MNKEEMIELRDNHRRLGNNRIADSLDNALYFIDNLQSQLSKEKEIKNKIREYCNERLKYTRDNNNDYWAGKNNGEQNVSTDILSLLGDE